MGTCQREGCNRPSRKRGFCDSDYHWARRKGLPKVKYPPHVSPDWTPVHTELAWAAGFADGEGSFYVTNNKTTRTRLLTHFDVGQSGDKLPYVLQRFQQAVGGLGRIDGPRVRPGYKDTYKLQFNGHQQVQAVLAMLWPWLSPVKREQATTALERARWTPTL